jgi:tripartite-type tricarboxylate transporter receptor subunit TctC
MRLLRTLPAALTASIAATSLALASPASAKDAAITFEGKVVSLYAGGQVGGGVDVFSRTLMMFLARHLPGEPTIVVKNLHGAGGMQAVSYAYNKGAKDGTALTTMAGGPIAEAIYGDHKLDYDLQAFHWIGSLAVGKQMCMTWHTSAFQTIQDAIKRTMNVSATGARSNTALLPLMLNATIGTKFRPIAGYGGAGSVLAVERGEMDGICSSIDSLRTTHPDWIDKHEVRFLLDVSLTGINAFKGVPRVMDMIGDPKKKAAMELFLRTSEITYPYALTPGTPDAVVKLYRAAFDTTVRDPAYLKQAARQKQSIEPKSGAEVTDVIDKMIGAPAEVVASVKSYLNNAGGVGKCEGSLCGGKKKKGT